MKVQGHQAEVYTDGVLTWRVQVTVTGIDTPADCKSTFEAMIKAAGQDVLHTQPGQKPVARKKKKLELKQDWVNPLG